MRCTVQTLVVRMLKDLPEHGKSMRGEMKALLREIKRNPQETNSEGKEAGFQINNLEHKEEINMRPEQNEETRIQNKQTNKNNQGEFQNSGPSPKGPISES